MSLFRRLFRPIRRFVADENGPTAVEYAVVLAMIIGTIVITISMLGQSTSRVYDDVGQSLDNIGGDGGGGAEGAEGGKKK